MGHYVCFLDIDDRWFSCKLQSQASRIAQDPDLGLLFSAYFRAPLGLRHGAVLRSPPPRVFLRQYAAVANPIPMLTACVRRDLVNYLRFEDANHEDYIFWWHLLFSLPLAQVFVDREPLAVYRVDRSSLSGDKSKAVFWIWNCYRRFGYSRFCASAALLARGLLQAFLLLEQKIAGYSVCGCYICNCAQTEGSPFDSSCSCRS